MSAYTCYLCPRSIQRAWVHSDAQLLRRILMNFVSNAVRYTEQGRILIGIRRRAGQLHIEVWDSGPGIPEPDRRAIFDEFRRGNDARGQGLGLGLAIAERTARLLGHPLHLRSWPGHGSVFSVSVPHVPAGQCQPDITPPASSAETSFRSDAQNSVQGRALVLDNDSAVRQAMRELLESWGWQVHTAADIHSARDIAQQQTLDLLLLDYHLDAHHTGLDAYSALSCNTSAIIITADRSDSVRESVEAAGLQLLHKPLRPLALRSIMQRLGSGF